MTKDFPKISAQQLFCVLFLSRLAVEIITPNTSTAPRETVLAIIITELARFLLALPLIIFSFKHDNFHRYVYKKSKVWGYISAAVAALLLIGAAVKTLFHTSGFAEKNLLVNGGTWLIFAIAAIFAVYAAFMGVEALARSGVLFLVAAGIITAAVFLADIPYFKTSDVWKITDAGTLFDDIITRFFTGGDYLIFAALLPYVNKKTSASSGKAALIFALMSTILPIIIALMNFLILREFYGLAEYPSAASASLSDISLFKRLDGIFSAVWTLCAAFRSGLMLLSSVLVFLSLKRVSAQEKAAADS